MTDHAHYARRLRDIADALEANDVRTHDALTPHPDSLTIINNRQTKRGQLNYAVPEQLQLQRRIRRYNADTDLPHGDIVALALDIYLRSQGYPPDIRQAGTRHP
ncbi:hypothetical protein ACFV06_16960 [Streptomyces sp. NPDC059618]|uniref:hypothetical protein n=1 Tax=Streptomyces sp. NPDC059618 TaxID=3346887 RepID=UPI003688391C